MCYRFFYVAPTWSLNVTNHTLQLYTVILEFVSMPLIFILINNILQINEKNLWNIVKERENKDICVYFKLNKWRCLSMYKWSRLETN